jgi:hypothetical protein
MQRFTVALAAAGLMLSLVPPGLSRAGVPAERPRSDAIVLAVANGEILIDMGTGNGLAKGMTGELLNRFALPHPLTGVVVNDLVPLAPVTVLQAGALVSAAVIEKGLLERVQAGDVVRFSELAPPPPPPSQTAASCPACPECDEDEETLQVQVAWLATVGRPLAERRRQWESFLSTFPHNRFIPEVSRELERLQTLDEELRAAAKVRVEQERIEAPAVTYHRALEELNEGTPFRPIVFVHSAYPVTVVRFYVRRAGEPHYRFATMARFGDAHYRIEVPPAQVLAPALEYYVEAGDEAGRRIPVCGSADAPVRVTVRQPLSSETSEAGRSSAWFSIEWADFFLDSPGQDFFWRAEGDFVYRLFFGPLYSFRMGFGIFEGVGGPAEQLEASTSAPYDGEGEWSPERLTLTYSYFEPELELGPYVHLIPRLVVGAIREKVLPGSDNRHLGESIFGFHTYLRIGREQGTNLVLGGSLTQEMGLEGLVTMNLDVFEHFPIGVSVAATNLPVGEDYAARLGFKVGWRRYDWMSVDALLGMNMRNIRHVGMGGGLGLSFNW